MIGLTFRKFDIRTKSSAKNVVSGSERYRTQQSSVDKHGDYVLCLRIILLVILMLTLSIDVKEIIFGMVIGCCQPGMVVQYIMYVA